MTLQLEKGCDDVCSHLPPLNTMAHTFSLFEALDLESLSSDQKINFARTRSFLIPTISSSCWKMLIMLKNETCNNMNNHQCQSNFPFINFLDFHLG